MYPHVELDPVYMPSFLDQNGILHMFKGTADNRPRVEKVEIGKLINLKLTNSAPPKVIGEGSISHPPYQNHAQGQGQGD